MQTKKYISVNEDSFLTVVAFSDYVGLKEEFAIVYEDAYGERKAEVVGVSELKKLLKGFNLLNSNT